jgi:hypothetical protein
MSAISEPSKGALKQAKTRLRSASIGVRGADEDVEGLPA